MTDVTSYFQVGFAVPTTAQDETMKQGGLKT